MLIIFKIKLFVNLTLMHVFNLDTNFIVKTVIWTNNIKISSHPKTKFRSYIWKVNLTLEIKLFARKFIRGKIPTRGNPRNIRLDINSDCSFHKNHLET